MQTTELLPPTPLDSRVSIPTLPKIEPRLALLAILGLGVAVRCRQYLGCPSYWFDEADVLLNVFDRSFAALVRPLQFEQVAPPVFLWIERALYVFAGSSEYVMRLPSGVASLAALLVMVPLARRFAGTGGWLWAVAFCAVSHHCLTHGREVKPYASDLLITELVLLAAAVVVLPGTSDRSRRWGLFGLALAALLAPWMSFPSVFVLGGVSLALLFEALRTRSRSGWACWMLVTALCVVSFAALWFGAARHYSSPFLETHWAKHFMDTSSLSAALRWILDSVIAAGNYATTGMGIPLVFFGTLGARVLWTRSPAATLLLVGPLALAVAAAGLDRYPLGDRLTFFAAPCLWLASAVGLGAAHCRLKNQIGRLAPLVLCLVLVPGAVRTTKYLVVLAPTVEFREAFDFVHRHWSAGDRLWVSHPNVYKAYFGDSNALLDSPISPDKIERASRAGGVWMVYQSPRPGTAAFPDLFKRLQVSQIAPILRHSSKTLEIVLCARSVGPQQTAGLDSGSTLASRPKPYAAPPPPARKPNRSSMVPN